MEEERLRWITRPATLDGYKISVDFSETPSGTIASLAVQGICHRKRGSLFIYAEALPVETAQYGLSDLVHHLALVLQQERPTTKHALERALAGDSWEQMEFPF